MPFFYFVPRDPITYMLQYVIWYQTSGKTIDHVDLLREQLKILSGEVALQTSVLKRLTEEAGRSPQSENTQVLPCLMFVVCFYNLSRTLAFYLLVLKMEMKKTSDEIKGKKRQIASLEREIAHATLGSKGKADKLELSPVMLYICFGFLLSLY